MVAADDTDTERPSTNPIVTCENASRRYERGGSSGGLFSRRDTTQNTVTALEDVDLTIRPGEFVGLQGPSGSGKSTLLHLVAALDTPTAGTVHVAGTNPATLSARQREGLRLETVGMIFQRFHLLSSLTALENVTVPMIERGVAGRERNERGTELLADVGLADRADHVPGQLSGGEQQRVAIARALALDPPVVVADEPTGELDTATGATILDQLGALADAGRAVVMASHDAAALERVDRVVHLRDGRVVDA